MCSLHLTHPSAHTWSSGQPTVQCPGSSRGLPAGAGIRTHNLGFSRVSSPTLYPLGHDCRKRELEREQSSFEIHTDLCCHPWLLVCSCGYGLGDCHIINALFDVSSHSFSVFLQVCVVVIGGRLFKYVPVCVLEAVLQC